jgi:acyl-CoA thioesterase FadM
MVATFRKEMIVEFADTDAAGLTHFATFFLYAERTEHAFLRSLGLSVAAEPSGETDPALTTPGSRTGWPRVHASFDYLSPLRFEDRFAVTLGVERIGQRSIHYRFLVAKQHTLCARGKIVAAHVHMESHTGAVQSAPVPNSLRTKIRTLNETELADFID